MFGSVSAAWTLGLGFAGYLCWHGWYLGRLLYWLALPKQRTLPLGLGRWGQAFDRLSRFARDEYETRSNMAAELERVRAAVHRMPDSLIVLDRSNLVQWYNRAAEELLGIVGFRRPIYHFVRDPEFSIWLEQAARKPLELSLPQHPGQRYVMRMLRSDETHHLLIIHDVTEQRRLDAMRRDFVANISHEIRTPLTVISGFVETMLDIDLDDASRRRYLDSILKQSDTMRRLIEDLLILAKLEHDLIRAGEETKIDLHGLLTILVGDAQALSAGRHEIRLSLNGPRWIKADPLDLQTVVRNLLTNAVRYTPDGGRIMIDWEKQGTDGMLCVRDTGIGIAAEHLPRLTERFYRVDRGRSRDSGGTGLGLAIVKHALQRYRATLDVTSKLGHGSRFAIRWPSDRLIEDHET
ncbi:MAG: phosphate regulon sensor histidine kinase PhoR [Betaproteobacteria bacterium]|nr:phosphate regulon sensor histidine kinase PhoR [Betaproteobacteria bacterium]